MIFLLKKDILNDKTKKILSYVPSAIFPAIIFPPIFLDSAGSLDFEGNPKILAAVFAIIIGFWFLYITNRKTYNLTLHVSWI